MNRLVKFLVALLLTTAQSFGQKADVFTTADSLGGALSPLRTCFDIRYYHLDVKIDPAKRTIEGSNRIVFNVVQPFDKFQIDLFPNMRVDKIIYRNKPLKFTRAYNAVFVEFPQKLAANALEEIDFFYSGKPTAAVRAPWDGGFVWEKDTEGNPWVGVACEGLGASSWWPNKDHLSDEPDSMLISVTVPKGLMNISNGRLRKQTEVDANWSRFDWFVSYPVNNYNVTVNIAKYSQWRDYHINGKDTLTLDYYVLPHNLERAKKHFEQVKPMMTCYERVLGKYPFYQDGYKLIETAYLGMEHQSAIAYGNRYLPGYSGSDISGIGLRFDYIIIHETAHEWWGNNVSCKDRADMWIHESFCTYSESLYVECMHNKATAIKYINAQKPGIQNNAPMQGVYGVNNEGAGDMYFKGALVLNTFRSVVDDDKIWFGIISGIQKDFALKTVTAEDMIEYINRKTGKDFHHIFNQYYKFKSIPTLELKFENTKGNSFLSYRWKANVAGFNMPVKVTLSGKEKFEWITPSDQWQKTEIKVSGQDLKVAEELFYIKVEKNEEKMVH